MYKLFASAILIITLLSVIFVLSFSVISPTRTVIITGANSGVGLATTRILAASNRWNVVMACRNIEKAEKARSTLLYGKENTRVEELDLADFGSIKRFAKRIKSQNFALNVLACNAGIQESTSGFGGKEVGNEAKRTTQGFELTVGTNHIGHFLLCKLLLDQIKSSDDDNGRIVFVGSGVHDPESPGGNVGSKATLGDMSGFAAGFKAPITMIDNGEYDPDKAYKDSKLCNVMTSIEFARRLKAEKSTITCNVMNPGLIPTTGLFRSINPLFVLIFTFLTKNIFRVAVSEEEGGKCLAYMIDNPLLNNCSGGYFTAVPGPKGKEFGIAVASKEAQDEEKGRKLWFLTEKLINSA